MKEDAVKARLRRQGVIDAGPAILERPAPAQQRIGAEEAMQKAERFLNRHLGHSLAAGTPQRVAISLAFHLGHAGTAHIPWLQTD